MADKPSFTCRMYEDKYPEVDDVVMVQVKSIAEMGAYVSLLEYNNIDGMILLSELSRRRIRSVNKLIKVRRGRKAKDSLPLSPDVLSSRNPNPFLFLFLFFFFFFLFFSLGWKARASDGSSCGY